MENQKNSHDNNIQGQVKNKATQLKTIFHFLNTHIATASMVSSATGIPRPNICRHKRDLEKNNQLCELDKKYCEITNHKAWYLTTNPELFPKIPKQLSIFD